MREQTLDHFQRFHLLGPAAEASVHTPRRIEPLDERVAHQYRVGHQSSRKHRPHEGEIASGDGVEKSLGLRHPVPLFRQPLVEAVGTDRAGLRLWRLTCVHERPGTKFEIL